MEAALLIVLVGMLSAAGSWIWRRAVGWGSRAGRFASTTALAVSLVSLGAYGLMNARTIQVIGEIVPRVDTDQPLVALTFDDGPVPPYTDELLRILGERDVKATFFVMGQNLEKSPALGEQLVAAGHELGNHSYSHRRMVLESYDFIRTELEQTDRRIRQAGHAGPIHFRSPYAKKLFLLPLYLWRTGTKNIIADVEPDAEPGTRAERMVEIALAQTRPGSIVILHAENAVRQESLRAVPGIVDGLEQKGYRFVTVSELLAR